MTQFTTNITTNTSTTNTAKISWLSICQIDDILPNMGCCALVTTASNQAQQIAIFRINSLTSEEQLFALDNYCPFSQANVISRGIVGDLDDKIVVASPLYKQHFELSSGQCLEDETMFLNTYAVRLNGSTVELALSPLTAAPLAKKA
ncbi:MAG: nitrite reductase (NAD(P)H) small subunit [Gammaproteobacteria bacterium]|nr:MAG: nitrite reductase (NAD(P)H) small subunit [Gammaproteobacteria bacterium]